MLNSITLQFVVDDLQNAFPGEHSISALGAVIHKEPDPLQAPPDLARIVVPAQVACGTVPMGRGTPTL